MPRHPTRPRASPAPRRNDVLALMVKAGSVPPSELRAFQERPILLAARAVLPCEAPGVVRQAIRELGRWSYGIDDLLAGRVQVRTTIDARIQEFALRSLETGLHAFRARHPEGRDEVQGAVVVLRNRDAAILAEVGGRPIAGRPGRYTDFEAPIAVDVSRGGDGQDRNHERLPGCTLRGLDPWT